MSVCIIGAGGGGVNRVERIIFRQDVPGTSKGIFSYILLGKPACDMVSFAWKAARTAAAACETGRAVCGCGAVKGPVVPWNGEQGRIAALNFVSLRFCAFFVAAVLFIMCCRAARGSHGCLRAAAFSICAGIRPILCSSCFPRSAPICAGVRWRYWVRRPPGTGAGAGRPWPFRWRQIWEFCFSSNIIIFCAECERSAGCAGLPRRTAAGRAPACRHQLLHVSGDRLHCGRIPGQRVRRAALLAVSAVYLLLSAAGGRAH